VHRSGPRGATIPAPIGPNGASVRGEKIWLPRKSAGELGKRLEMVFGRSPALGADARSYTRRLC